VPASVLPNQASKRVAEPGFDARGVEGTDVEAHGNRVGIGGFDGGEDLGDGGGEFGVDPK
jgi:hypothetical protein